MGRSGRRQQSGGSCPTRVVSHTLSPIALCFLAVAVIVLTAQLGGALARRCGQPRVMGEILAGIALGPSLLGALAPGLEAVLFSPPVRQQLDLLGQLGLVLFLFQVGMELDPRLLRQRLPLASRITLAALLVPLGLGVGVALFLERWQPELLPGTYAPAGALFLGTAMAITALPVLARILRERGLLGLPLGNLALSAAAIEDALDWVLLAAVVALTRTGSAWQALPVLLGSAAYATALLLLTRPLRRWLRSLPWREGNPGPVLQSALLAGVLVSAAITDRIGVHMIFGAFLWGVAMPRHRPLQEWMEQRLEATVRQLLLPLFFAVSGLNTSFGSLGTPELWASAGLVLGVAVLGKFLATWATARLGGLEPRQAEALGWLMNTRGLTELVVLAVGLELGVISRELYTIGVLMALVTTLMAGPLLDRLGYPSRPPAPVTP